MNRQNKAILIPVHFIKWSTRTAVGEEEGGGGGVEGGGGEGGDEDYVLGEEGGEVGVGYFAF